MDLHKIEELLPFYALDALTDEERELVEAYLREHPEARQQVEEMRRTVQTLPESVSAVQPSPPTRSALMARVAVDAKPRVSNPEQAARPQAGRWVNLFQAFGLGAATVAILWAVVLNVQLSYLRQQVSTLNQALLAQSQTLERINQQLTQQPAPETVTISLKGTDVQPQAQGQLIADPKNNSGVLIISGLDQLEAGKTYQVWLIDASGPKSAGLLSVDAKGQAVLIVTSGETIGSFQSLGISVEPNGGSQQPTGEIVVLSDL